MIEEAAKDRVKGQIDRVAFTGTEEDARDFYDEIASYCEEASQGLTEQLDIE